MERFSTMATEEDGNIDSLVSIICKDVLERRNFKSKCEEFLTKVSVPASWPEGNAYRLHQGNPTYRYRKKILSNFIQKRVSEGFTVKSSTTKQFFDELQEFSALSESNDSFSEFWSSERPALIDLFEQNIKLCGPVVRKSDTELKVSVLIKTRGRNRQDDNLSLTEHVIDLQNELEEGCRIKVGDILEVTKCRRNEGVAFEPGVIKCYSLDQNEMDSFLELVLKCVETEGSTAAVTELSRCHAVWDYILELSAEKYTPEMALKILSILDKICSSAQKQMSHTVSKIVRGFQQSVFFMSFLPCFVEKMTEESNISVVHSILEHVVSVIPAAGPKVLPMAKVLCQNLVNGSHDLQTAKRNGQSAIGFLSKLSSVIALNVPEALENLQSLQWKDLPLIPVVDEIHKPRVNTDDLPVIRKEGKYSTEDEYFNTNFRLLREECFYKLRRGIHDFVTPGNKWDLKEIMMYRICLRGVSTAHEKSPTAMLLSLEYDMPDENDWEPSNWLLFGDLLCISIDGSFQEPVWAVVENHVVKQRIVRISLCEKANRISEAEFIAKMQEVTNRNKRAFMAESQTFYRAFGPAMEVLQHKDHVPFKEFLVYPDPDYMKPAEYINKIKSPPDWEIIFHRDPLLHYKGGSSDYSLLKDFERIRLNSSCKSWLDETQLAAVELALKNKLVLIQGPPGTGKSFVGVALVHLLLSMNVPQNYGPILVVTYKNLALDNFLLDCVKKVSSPDVKIVRVGTLAEDADIKLKQCLLREVGRSWPERLYRQKRNLQGRLWGMQREVRRTFQKLTFSSIFNAYMFLEEASDDQTRSLLVDNESQTVDRAQVETLLKEKGHNHRSMSHLRELVDKALREWLPSQDVFDRFAGEKNLSEQKTRSAGITKQKSKDEQDQENPNDFRDPSVEEKERRRAMDQDEEEEGSVKDEDIDLKNAVRDAANFRKLICVDETKVNPYKNLLDAVKVWELEENERVQLVYVFQSRNYKKASHEFLDISSEYTQIHHQFKELRNQHDIEVMKSCHVIGMTVTGATIRANMLADIKPAVMIVEEAAEILEGQLVAVIPPSVQHLIMIGDHKQLSPVVHFHRLKKHHHLDVSMFERLFNCRVPHRQLGFQCRMRDEIVDLLRELNIYTDLRTNHELVRRNVLPNCVESSMYFWTHTSWESESRETSKRNTREAREITEVATTFCEKGRVQPSKITVLCSYRGQVLEIKRQFETSNISALADIVVTTIDSFQGQENDIILISLVRSNKEGKIGYLSSLNRLCVAISRARCGLYLFGNHAHLAKASKKGWKVVTDFMWKMKCRGSKFPFGDIPKSALHSESQFQENFSTREKPTQSTTVHANEAILIIGDNNLVNTDPPGSRASGTGPPRHLKMSFPPSGKIPAHDPKSPTPQEGCPPQRMEGSGGSADIRPSSVPVQVAEREGHGADVKSTKEARMPIQVSPEARKSTLEHAVESTKEGRIPTQVTPEAEKSTLEHAVETTKEAGMPIQVTAEAKKSFSDLSEIEKAKEGPIPQESQNPKNSIADTTIKAEEFVADDKETRQPTQATSEAEKSSANVSELENMKETPVQESENPKSSILGTPVMGDEFVKVAPVQESEQPKAKKDELKENPERSVRHVFQEGDLKELVKVRQTSVEPTSEDSKVEIEDQRDGRGEQPLQETRGPGKVQRTEAEDTAQVKKGEEAHEEPSEGKPLQESTSSDVKPKTCKEEPLPTQETMPAGKGPFEETGDEVGFKGQPSVSEEKPLQQHDSFDVQNKSCEEEPLPTQETMAAGKGPFEETGLEVGVKGQPTDEQE